MSEARANTERPTGEADVSAEDLGTGDSDGPEGAAGRSPRCPTKDVVITVRMTADDAADLTYIGTELGSSSGPEAVRETIRIAATVLRGEQYRLDRTQREALRTDVPQDLLVNVRDTLRANADAHSAVEFQFQKIGNNVNQLARVANSGDLVPAPALAGVQRALERIGYQLKGNAQRDADLAIQVRRGF